jgi:serine/threonine protein kinase
MPFIPGGTLKLKLGKPWAVRDAARMLLPVAHALVYAHGQGIIHRDLKPSNILLNASGEPLISDFGIAKILETPEGYTLTGTGEGIGTPDYMAPEQSLGTVIDNRVDIYSLGIVLFEMLTARRPYTGDTPVAILLRHVYDPLPDPRQFVPGLPDAAVNVLTRALAKNPADRFASMADFAGVLVRLTESVPEELKPAEQKPVEITQDDLRLVELEETEIQPEETKPVELKPAETTRDEEIQTDDLEQIETPRGEEILPAELELEEITHHEEVPPAEFEPAEITRHEEIQPADLEPPEITRHEEILPADLELEEITRHEEAPPDESEQAEPPRDEIPLAELKHEETTPVELKHAEILLDE